MNAMRSCSSLAIFPAVLLACSWVSGTETLTTASSAETPDALVQSALQAELQGDLSRRTELLHDALNKDGSHPATNWHLGYMRYQTGDWLSVTQHQQLNATDPTLLEYRNLREKLANERDADWDLAKYCMRNGMEDVAAVHYSRVLTNTSYDRATRKKAMRHLGLELYKGVPMTEEQIKTAKQQEEDFEEALTKWVPRLRKLQERLNEQSEQAQRLIDELQSAEDPHLARVIELFIPQTSEPFGQAVVSKLGQMQSQDATEVLVKFSVLSQWMPVRQAAIDELKLRSMFDYVPLLISGLQSPIDTQWQITEGPGGSISYQHVYYQEGATVDSTFENILRYVPRANSFVQGQARERFGRFIDVLRSIQEAENRERAIAQMNLVASTNNQRVFEVLEETTRAQVVREPKQWREWWQDYNDVEFQKQQSYRSQQQQRLMTSFGVQSPTQQAHECFIPGTKVWTETGVQPIETIRIGDRVLSQQPDTGELSFKPVLATTIRQSTPVVEMYFDSERITSTLGHPVWVTGEGWRMAKHLLPDHQLHSLYGGTHLKKIARLEAPATVINLVVADFHSYFVGETAILVHDNLYREPTRSVVPGLQPDE